jgi:hypothetical protein
MKGNQLNIIRVYEPVQNRPIKIKHAIWNRDKEEIIITQSSQIYYVDIQGKIHDFVDIEYNIIFIYKKNDSIFLMTKIKSYHELIIINDKYKNNYIRHKLFHSEIRYSFISKSENLFYFITFDSEYPSKGSATLIEYNIKDKFENTKKIFPDGNLSYYDKIWHEKEIIQLQLNEYTNSIYINSIYKKLNSFREILNINEYIEEFSFTDFCSLKRIEIINTSRTSHFSYHPIAGSAMKANSGECIIYYDYNDMNIYTLDVNDLRVINKYRFFETPNKHYASKKYIIDNNDLEIHLGDSHNQHINVISIIESNDNTTVFVYYIIRNYDGDIYYSEYHCIKTWKYKQENHD